MKKIFLLVLILTLNWLIFRTAIMTAIASWEGKNLVSEVKMGKLWGNFDQSRTDAVEFSGWSGKDNIDLSLDPQTKGVAIYEFTRPEEARKTILQIALAKPSPGSNKISVSTDQNNWQTAGENKYYHLVPLDITGLIGRQSKFWVKIEASNEAVAGPPTVVLYDFYLMFYNHEFIFPSLVPILVSVFIPILIIVGPTKKKMIKACLLFLIFSWGLYLAWQNLYSYRYHSFDGDVICLTQEVPRLISLDFKPAVLGNYCGNKESLNPLIIIAGWKLFGYGSEMGIRFTSIFFHILTIMFVFWYGKKIKSFTTGLIAALFVGTHPYLVQLSARGLRDTVFTLIIMVFAYLLFETGLKRARNWLAIFLIGVGSIYVRLHSLFQLIGLLIIFVALKEILNRD